MLNYNAPTTIETATKMINTNHSFTHYILTDNATGAEYVETFAGQVHSILGPVSAGGLTYEQAARQIAIWNRSQVAHKQEFSYRLV